MVGCRRMYAVDQVIGCVVGEAVNVGMLHISWPC